MSIDAYSEMVRSFTDRIGMMKALLAFSELDDMREWNDKLELIDSTVQELEYGVTSVKKYIARENESVEQAQKLQEAAKEQLQYVMQYIQTNLPAHLPDLEQTQQEVAAPVVEKENACRARMTREKSKKADAAVPKMSYVTVSELEKVPPYIKQRATIDKVNAAIDEIMSVLSDKFKVTSQPLSKLSGPAIKRFKEYKDQMLPELEKSHFFVEADIRNSQNLKSDASGKAVLQILRSCGRLKEVRNGGLLRYVMV